MTTQTDEVAIYQVYVQTITATEQRRQNAAAVYLAIVSALVALAGSDYKVDPVYLAVPITLVGLIWTLTIRYFRRLAKAKFAVIHEMEKGWAFKPFDREWENYKSLKAWKVSLTHIETTVPALIFLGGIGYLAFRLAIFAAPLLKPICAAVG
ncbi:hypothetical protein GG681_08110 [Epibacterium sp. SM1969]|uniref:Uncharacterized protein n=1 Tax=Tritonibacter aquimaris TaxID=2663379 RepID=A0A844ALD6_9RHOB|nr:hypothetical protein [Tritonibacter aquimaris]MQY42605.1 hypothetical protein [Tritonibacter aquimaris]